MYGAEFVLTSGPNMASPRALSAMSAPVMNPYDPDFLTLFKGAERMVGELYETRNDIVLLQAEAIAGIEAAVRSLVRPGMAVLNIATGPYGHAMGPWLGQFGATVHSLDTDWDNVVDPEDVDAILKANPEIELITVVHCDTPCGTLNPVQEIGQVARKHGVITFVDAASTLGSTSLKVDEWMLDVCVAASQKCLAGPLGLSLISISDEAWNMIDANPSAPRDSFLSLLDWRTKWFAGGKFPAAPNVSDVYGIAAAVSEVVEEGLPQVIARHDRAARACRAGSLAMGLSLFPRRQDIGATCVTTISLPDGVTDTQVRDLALERYGVMIQDSLGAGNVVSIAHMGRTANSVYPLVGLLALGGALTELGHRVDVGAGVDAALATMASDAAAVA